MWRSTGETTATINPTPTVTTAYYVTVNNGISSCQDSVTVNVLPTSALAIDTAVCDMFFAKILLPLVDCIMIRLPMQ